MVLGATAFWHAFDLSIHVFDCGFGVGMPILEFCWNWDGTPAVCLRQRAVDQVRFTHSMFHPVFPNKRLYTGGSVGKFELAGGKAGDLFGECEARMLLYVWRISHVFS